LPSRPGPGSPRSAFLTVALVLAMIAVPAAVTLHRVRVPSVVAIASPDPSPLGYTVSLLLFIFPTLVILLWLVPRSDVRISRHSFLLTIAILFPIGALLDFCFAHLFFRFPNPQATLQIPAPALGDTGLPFVFLGSPSHIVIGSVPIEEYVFYLTGFTTILLLYIWLDEYWLFAYSVPVTAAERTTFSRLLRFHPASLILAVALIAFGILYRHRAAPHIPGFPGYFTFLVAVALAPSAALFPSALPVVNWRAFSLTLCVILLTSMLWEATLAVPYGWWQYRRPQMLGLFVTAWDLLPIEAVCVWIAVTYPTVMVYEVIRRWRSSGKSARRAFLG